MPIKATPLISERVLHVRLNGTLTDDDYKQFVPELERLIAQHGSLRLLIEMSDFHGWSAGALWDDLKVLLKHGKEIERVAIVGEKSWQEWMARMAKPFLHSTIQFFDRAHASEARRWVLEECISTQ
jgi:hypothetical protein